LKAPCAKHVHLERSVYSSNQKFTKRYAKKYEGGYGGKRGAACFFVSLKLALQGRQKERANLLNVRRMASSGMLRRVALVRNDDSEELSASFIRVTRIGELGKTSAVTSNRRTLRRNTCHHD
jgi:hypothetical protein